jgi:hypothetical protein
VLLVEAKIPKEAKVVYRKDQGYRDVSGIVLAAGEATGHHHVVKERGANMFRRGVGGTRYVRVRTRKTINAWKCKGPNGPCHIPSDVDKSKLEDHGYKVLGCEDVVGVTVRHEEHLPYVLPNGEYEIRRQREYVPPKDQVSAPRQSYVSD